jgi:hypothetical protein
MDRASFNGGLHGVTVRQAPSAAGDPMVPAGTSQII